MEGAAPFETTHAVSVGDARSLPYPDESVELVVTSPPYPMIEQWDELYAELDPAIGEALDAGEGRRAFDLMHETLREAWAEIERVLVEGGIACVNVGDATRRLADRFRLYPNHVRVSEAMRAVGLEQLPGVLWHKPTNAPTKFMGSGTLPPNAYVTLEHEHVLVFRKGGRREFPPGATPRYEGAFFYEERNEWFSDRWELQADRQATDTTARDRRAAFPVELPYRLISMFSVYGDRVLDPFWGTGTTTLAAMLTGRASAGLETERSLIESFDGRLDGLADRSREWHRERLDRHREFVTDREPDYSAEQYDFGVVTGQERNIQLYAVEAVSREPGGYRVRHVPFEA